MDSLSLTTEAAGVGQERRTPLTLVGALCALLAYLCTLTAATNDDVMSLAILLGLGALASVLTLLDLRVGLGLLIFSIGISPEFQALGVSNLRMEDFLLPVILIGWLFRSLAFNEKPIPSNLKLPLILTFLLSAVSSIHNSLYSELRLVSCLFRMGKLLEYFLIFVVTLNILQKKKDLVFFIYLMPLVGAFVGVQGIFQAAQSQDRVSGPMGETANILGGYYVLHICLALGLVVYKVRHRALMALVIAVIIIPLVFTKSRTSYVSLVVSLLAMFAARRTVWTGLVLAACALAVLSSSDVTERFLTLFGVFQGNAPSSLVMRVKGWATFLDWLPHAPFMGHGLGNVTLGAFDSEYVRVIFELGLLGLLLFFWLFGVVLGLGLRLTRQTRSPEFQGFSLGVFGATVALLVHSIGATTFTAIRTAEPFFFATGLLYAINWLHEPYGRLEDDLPSEMPPESARRIAPILGAGT